MIVLINGSFGVGKTTTAEALVASLPNALLYDPEEVGFMLRSILGKFDPRDDFQDFPMWPSLVAETARSIKEAYGCDLIVPMTLRREDYLSAIMGGLRQVDNDCHHFCLLASQEEIFRRLRSRGETEGGSPYQQVPKCIAAFASPAFEQKIDVESLRPEQVVDLILANVGR
jgi:AAA domain-containing protein